MTEHSFSLQTYASYALLNGDTVRVVHVPSGRYALWIEVLYPPMGWSPYTELSTYLSLTEAMAALRHHMHGNYPEQS
jgi:hypothetical protein